MPKSICAESEIGSDIAEFESLPSKIVMNNSESVNVNNANNIDQFSQENDLVKNLKEKLSEGERSKKNFSIEGENSKDNYLSEGEKSKENYLIEGGNSKENYSIEGENLKENIPEGVLDTKGVVGEKNIGESKGEPKETPFRSTASSKNKKVDFHLPTKRTVSTLSFKYLGKKIQKNTKKDTHFINRFTLYDHIIMIRFI